MDLQDWSNLATICGVGLTFAIGCATVSLLYFAFKLNRQGQELAKQSQELARQSKQADVTSEFNARFSRAWEMRYDPRITTDPMPYYERFWNLQFDQFQAWRAGFVPDETFQYWLTSRYRDWLTNNSIGAISYKEGFGRTVGKWNHAPFHDFMETLHKRGADAAIAQASKDD